MIQSWGASFEKKQINCQRLVSILLAALGWNWVAAVPGEIRHNDHQVGCRKQEVMINLRIWLVYSGGGIDCELKIIIWRLGKSL